MKLTTVTAFILTALLLAGCGKGNSDADLTERFTVKEVDLRDAVRQTGEVEPVVRIELKSEATGKIEKIFVKEGEAVKEGQKVLTIDPERLNTRKKKLDLAVREARIRMDLAKRDLDNAQELFATGTVPRSKLEDLESEYQLREISYKQQMLELDDVVDQLEETVVVAPMDGVITTLDVEEGEIAVSATSGYQSGTLLATIADISRLEVVTQIGEVDYVHLEEGQNVVIRPEALEDIQTRGKIDFISLTAKKRSGDELGTFEVRIAIDSLVPGIAPGVNVNVEFVILEKNGVCGVPYHFVRKRGGKAFVSVVDKGNDGNKRIKPVPVRLGGTDFKHYEIVSGVKEGDVVVFRQERPEREKKRRRRR